MLAAFVPKLPSCISLVYTLFNKKILIDWEDRQIFIHIKDNEVVFVWYFWCLITSDYHQSINPSICLRNISLHFNSLKAPNQNCPIQICFVNQAFATCNSIKNRMKNAQKKYSMPELKLVLSTNLKTKRTTSATYYNWLK